MATRKPAFEVRTSAIQGRGVYATRRIPKSTWIVEYTGELITHNEADLRYDDESMDRHHTFLFTVDDTWCLDAITHGSDARFINHSCDPNCEAVLESDSRRIWIVAMRDLRSGEELTYDYGYALDDTDRETALRVYPCHCGAAICRGTILKD